MVRNYYYLVAGCADLVLGESRGAPDIRNAFNELLEQVHPDDARLLRFIRYPIDNANVCALLQEEEYPFDERGNYSRDELQDALRSGDELPQYLQRFLEARREGVDLFPGLQARDQLAWLFYEEAFAHPNRFIREWFGFECDLRNLLAAATIRRFHPTTPEKGLLLLNDTAQTLSRSTAPDFSMGAQFSWVERVLALQGDNPAETEQGIDRLRWEMLDELTIFSYFQIESLLAFCIRLQMVDRWMRLDPREGEEKLRMLVDGLLEGFSASSGAVAA